MYFAEVLQMRKDNMKDRRIALADCNNFFVSCERRVDTRLDGRPVVVLSGNDGCVISRSNEVKKMGVPRGAPYFKFEKMLAYNGVAVRSANHKLYQSISSEVMSLIKKYTDCQEIYSIDECFFNMGIAAIPDPVEYCAKLRLEIWKKCRIPVSIGIAPTKTLAKLGTEYAKKHRETNGVFWMDILRYKDEQFIEQFPCRDVWGIGPRVANSLCLLGINNVAQFTARDDVWIKDKFGLPGLNTAWELRGFSVSPIVNVRKPQKSIMVSRSFGEAITDFAQLSDALLSFTVSAASQLRRTGQAAGKIQVYVMTNRFGQDYYANAKEYIFSTPETLDSAFIRVALDLLRQIYIAGKQYKKCGVVLSNFTNTTMGAQMNLFADESEEKLKTLTATVDHLNNEGMSPVMKPAVLFEVPEDKKKWKSKSEFRTDEKELMKNTSLDGLRFQSHAEDF